MPADTLATAVRGFACPFEPMDESLRQTIVSEYARGYLAAFVDRYRSSLGSVAEELAEAAASDIPFDIAWDISFGKIRRAVHAQSELPDQAAAAVVARLQGEQSSAPACKMAARSLRILDGAAAASVEPFDAYSPGSPWSSDEILARCGDAVELLRTHSPRYLTWVDDVIRYVLPRDGSDGMMRSASNNDWPGVISVSFPSSAAALAEVLVHEASHQHLNIVRRLGPLVNDEDHELYHSPLKGIPRPIGAILVAFHAVANMVLWYREGLDSGIQDGGYCEANLIRHREDARVMLEQLETSTGLTPVGRTIVDAAAEHLQARVF